MLARPRSEGRAGSRHLEFQHVQHFNGAVIDVQHPVGVEVESLSVGSRQQLGYYTGPVQDVDRLVVVEVGRPLIVGLIVGARVIGAGVQRVSTDEQFDLISEPEGVA